MIIEQVERKIERSADFQEQFFGIGDLSVIMMILRSKLYGNPVRAFIQEVMCNARDANRENKCEETPVSVNLPSDLSPKLEINDNGIGITPDRMANVFLKYGNTTKGGDNVQTGGFGIGAKSPFAYTDSFTVETVTQEPNGSHCKRIYCAFIDETNVGKMSILLECPTDEHTGTSIQVPIKSEDFNVVERYVMEVSRFWATIPTISPEVDDFEQQQVSPCFFNDHNTQGFMALIDRIPYKLGNIHFSSSDFTPENLKVLEFYSKYDLILSFETGEIEVSANREQVTVTPDVIKKISQKILNYDNDICTKVQNEVNAASSFPDSIKVLSDFLKDKGEFWSKRFIREDRIVWQGLPVSLKLKVPDDQGTLYVVQDFGTPYVGDLTSHKDVTKYLKKNRSREIERVDLSANNWSVLIVDDEVTDYSYRLHHLLTVDKVLTDSRFLIIRAHAGELPNFLNHLQANQDKFLQILLGYPTTKVYKLSEVKYVKPVVVRKQYTRNNNMIRSGFRLLYGKLENKELLNLGDPNVLVVAIQGCRYSVFSNVGGEVKEIQNLTQGKLESLINTANYAKTLESPKIVVGVTQKKLEKIEHNCMSFYDSVVESLTQNLQGLSAADKFWMGEAEEDEGMGNLFDKILKGDLIEWVTWLPFLKDLNLNTTTIKEGRWNTGNRGQLKSLAQHLHIWDSLKVLIPSNIIVAWNTLMNVYPILKHVRLGYSEEDYKSVEAAIKTSLKI